MAKLPPDSVCDRISRGVLLLLGIGMVLAILIPAGPGWDFANFYDAGHKIVAGQTADLYNSRVLIEGKPAEGHLPYYGTPISAVLLAPLGWLSPRAGLMAFKIQNTLALLLALWFLYRQHQPVAARAGLTRSQHQCLFLVAAALFQPFWTIFRVGGQTTPTLCLGFVLALGWLASGRLLAAAVSLVSVVAIKPAFVLVLAVLAVLAGVRFFLYAAGCGMAAGALSVLAMGWRIHQSFLQHITEQKISSWTYNSSLSVFADNLYVVVGPSSLWRALGLAVRLLAAALLIVAWLRGRRGVVSQGARLHWLFLTAVTAGVALMPIVWEHYLSVLFLPVAYLLALLPGLERAQIRLLVLVCGFAATQNVVLILWLSDHLQLHSVPSVLVAAILKSAPLLLSTLLLWHARRQLITLYNDPGARLQSPR
ncbi:MAG: glycosyltransferase 87 family protein [Candidatus Solibacter sp.]